MPGTDFTLMNDAQLLNHIRGLAASTWPWDVTSEAVRGVLGYNDLFAQAKIGGQTGANATSITVANFKSYVTTLKGYLTVAMPAVPADLEALPIEDKRTLAQAIDVAFWDVQQRRNALANALTYYRQVVTTGGTPPTILVFRDTFLDLANAVRTDRGLTNIAT